MTAAPHASSDRSLWAASALLHLVTLSLLLWHMTPATHRAAGESDEQAHRGRRLLEEEGRGPRRQLLNELDAYVEVVGDAIYFRRPIIVEPTGNLGSSGLPALTLRKGTLTGAQAFSADEKYRDAGGPWQYRQATLVYWDGRSSFSAPMQIMTSAPWPNPDGTIPWENSVSLWVGTNPGGTALWAEGPVDILPHQTGQTKPSLTIAGNTAAGVSVIKATGNGASGAAAPAVAISSGHAAARALEVSQGTVAGTGGVKVAGDLKVTGLTTSATLRSTGQATLARLAVTGKATCAALNVDGPMVADSCVCPA